MRWRIALRPRYEDSWADLPRNILTIAPGFRHESMPDEVGILLPTNDGPKSLVEAVVDGAVEAPVEAGAADPARGPAPGPARGPARGADRGPDRGADTILGLFLASPFLNLTLEGERLSRAGVAWLTNLPSVAQQDEEFLQQLADVGLDHGRELGCLSRFRAQGFKIAVVVTNDLGAAAAAAIDPEAMIVLPRVADFAAGFPSLRQRGAAAQSAAEAARSAGWSGLVLGLADAREADHETLWPEPLHGVVCRPKPD